MSPTPTTPKPGGAAVDLTRHEITVLMVDDQRIICEAVRRMLLPEDDMRFHSCNDPRQAVAQATEIRPTVILQDLVMPEIDGLDLVAAYRAEEPIQEVPLIVLSTKEDPAIKAEAFARGANDYMVKFPDRLEMVARLRYHSQAYIHRLERNEAYARMLESQHKLARRNRFIRETFGRYLSDDVVESLLETPEGLALGGEKREVTLIMSDLRGFTAVAEQLAPERVVSMLNYYLGRMTEVVLEYGGTIDEFIGDAILVIFGAPVRRTDHADRAVACAVAMQRAMREVNDWNLAHDLPRMEMGIGVNSGEVVVGNIGSQKRAKYGVVGSQVNLTGRIESYTVGGQILISDMTRSRVQAPLEIQSEMEVEPKGVSEPLTLFEVRGIGPPFDLVFEGEPMDELVALAEPIPVVFGVLEGKHATSHRVEGTLVRLSPRRAELVSAEPLDPLSNLRLQLAGDAELATDFYGKVLAEPAEHPGADVIRFTSMPPDVEARLAEVGKLG